MKHEHEYEELGYTMKEGDKVTAVYFCECHATIEKPYQKNKGKQSVGIRVDSSPRL